MRGPQAAPRQVWPAVPQAWPGTAPLVPVSPRMPKPGKGTPKPNGSGIRWPGQRVSPQSRTWGEVTIVQLSVTYQRSDVAPNPAGTDPISTELSGEMGKNCGMLGWFGLERTLKPTQVQPLP